MLSNRTGHCIPTGLVALVLAVAGEARANLITTDWTSSTANSATGTLDGTTITGSILSGAPFQGIFTGSFAPPFWNAPQPLDASVESIALIPVNSGADHDFAFSTPLSYVRFYIENFDSSSDAVVTAVGATSISMVAASPSMSYTMITPSSGRLLTSNGGFNGEGDAILDILGSVQSVRLQYSNGIQDNGIAYTFATTAVPEPSSLTSAALGLVGLAGYAGWRRRRRRTIRSPVAGRPQGVAHADGCDF